MASSTEIDIECMICMCEKKEFSSLCKRHIICKECALSVCATGNQVCPYCRREYKYSEVEKLIDEAPVPAYGSEQPPKLEKKVTKTPPVYIKAAARKLSFSDENDTD